MRRKKREFWKKITVVTLSAVMVVTSGGVYELTEEVGRLWKARVSADEQPDIDFSVVLSNGLNYSVTEQKCVLEFSGDPLTKVSVEVLSSGNSIGTKDYIPGQDFTLEDLGLDADEQTAIWKDGFVLMITGENAEGLSDTERFPESNVIRMDLDIPELNLTVNGERFNSESEDEYIGQVEVLVTAEDDYLMSIEGEITYPDNSVDPVSITCDQNSYELPAERFCEPGEYSLTYTVTDHQGREVSKDISFSIVDSSPDINISYRKPEGKTEADDVSGVVELEVQAKDTLHTSAVEAGFSGEEDDVTYKLLTQVTPVPLPVSGEEDDEDLAPLPDIFYPVTREETEEDAKEISGLIKIDTSRYPCDSLEVLVQAVDAEGNAKTETFEIHTDNTAPVITLQVDPCSEPIVENVYPREITFLVSVRDRNFDPDGVVMKVGNDRIDSETVGEIGEWSTDSEDPELHTCNVVVRQNGIFSVEAEDTLGNSAQETDNSFSLDRNAPVITELKLQEAEADVYTGDVTVLFEATDDIGLDYDSVSYSIYGVDREGKLVSTEGTYTTETDFQTDPKHIAAKLKIEKSGRYTVLFQISDIAGNVTKSDRLEFVLTNDAPAGTIYVDSESSSERKTGITFDTVYSSDRHIVINGTDSFTEVQAIYSCIATRELTDEELETKAVWNEYTGSILITGKNHERIVVYAKIINKAGLVSYICTPGFVMDRKAPSAEISIESPAGATADTVFGTDVTLGVKVEDPVLINQSAGVKTVEYEIYSPGNEEPTQKGTVNGSVDPDTGAFLGTIVVDHIVSSGDGVVVKVLMTDNADNSGENSISLNIDTVKPVAEIRSEDEDGFFDREASIDLLFTEEHFSKSNVTVLLTKDGTPLAADEVEACLGAALMEEDGKWLIPLKVSEDGTYHLTVQFSDDAGNPADDQNYDFTVDTVDPVITFEYDATQTTGTGVNQFTGAIDVTICINDINFDEESAEVLITRTDSKGNPIDTGTYTFSGDDFVQDPVNGARYTRTVTLDGSANYTISVTAADCSGNPASDSKTFTVDLDDPVGKITATDFGSWDKLQDRYSFERFSNADQLIGIEGTDEISGIGYIQYYLSDQSMTLAELESLVGWEGYRTPFVLPADDKKIVYARITDKAGHHAYLSSEGLVLDCTDPDLSVDYSAQSSGDILYNRDIVLDIKAEDKEVNGACSGISEIRYEVYRDGTVLTQKNSLDVTQGSRKFSGSMTVRSALNNSNRIDVYVYITDRAGNENSKMFTVRLDNSDPVVSISADAGCPSKKEGVTGNYYADPVILDVNVAERNFLKSKAAIRITKDGTLLTDISEYLTKEWTYVSGAGTDSAKYTAVLTFPDDGDYIVSAEVEDAAGNSGSAQYEEFTVDRKKPVIAVSYDTNDATGSGENCFNVVRTATVKVIEHNFDPSSVEVSVLQKDAKGNTISGATYGSLSSWTDNGDVHTASMVFSGSAVYDVSVSAVDRAGNRGHLKTDGFTVDTESPEGTVTIGDLGFWSRLLSTVSFGLYSNKNQKVTIDATDRISGVDKVQYCLSDNELDFSALSNYPLWKNYTGAFELAPGSANIVYCKITDRAGNVSYVSSQGVILDASKPLIDISISSSMAPSESSVYRENVKLAVHVGEKDENGVFAGLKSISYEVIKDGEANPSQKGSWNVTSGAQSYDTVLTVLAEKNNSNNIVATVTAEDLAGNTFSKSFNVSIDTTKPTMTLRRDESGSLPYKGSYYSKPVALALTVKERNFSENLVKLSVTRDGEPVEDPYRYVAQKFKLQNGAGTDESEYRMVLRFEEDGLYTVSAEMKDLAGNTASVSYDAFTVDSTKPKFAISYDVNEKTGSAENYFNVTRTATVSVTERNFDPATTVLSVVQRDRSGNVLTGKTFTDLSNWTRRGASDVYDATITFNGSAAYTYTVEITDLAGNKATSGTESFTVDRDAPTGSVTIGALGNWSYFSYPKSFVLYTNENQKVLIQADDVISGVSGIQYYLSDTALSEAQLKGITSWKTYSNSFELKPDRADIVYVKITDLAGNVTYLASDGVVLDAVVPEFKIAINSSMEPAGASVYNRNVKLDVHVGEKDVNGVSAGLKSISYEVYKDGDKNNPTQKGTWNVTSGSKAYDTVLTILKDRNNSNNVTAVIYAEDLAGNKSSKSFKVSIDTTVPVMELVRDESGSSPYKGGSYYADAAKLRLTVTERNFDADLVELTITKDKKKVEDPYRYVTKKFEALGQTGTDSSKYRMILTFDEDGVFEVSASMKDTAGNEAKVSYNRFTVDKTRPSFAISYDVNEKTGSAENYFNVTRTATVSVTEHNFDSTTAVLSVIQKDKDGNVLNNRTYSELSNWTRRGASDVYDATITFNGSAAYTYTVEITDLAGNKATSKTERFTVDKDAPKGTAAIGTLGSWENCVRPVTFELFSNSKQTVTLQAEDTISGVDRIEYYVANDSVSASTLPTISDWKKYTGSFEVAPDAKVVIYAKLTDLAGNVSFVSTNGLILDLKAPAPVISISTVKPPHDIYNSDVDVQVEITDQMINEAFAGIKTAEYEVYNGNTMTQKGSFAIPSGELCQRISERIRIDSSKNNSNQVMLVVRASDNAGNKSEERINLGIDIVSPSISTSLTRASQGRYYGRMTECRATVVITERNFDPSLVSFRVKRDGVITEDYSIGGWSNMENSADPDRSTHTAVLTFDRDGDYEVEVVSQDKGMNRSEHRMENMFTVDKTAPASEISFNRRSVDNKYFNELLDVTVTIREHNFDPAGVTATLTGTLSENGSAVSQAVSASADEWEKNGDVYTHVFHVKNEGEYEVVVSAKDMATNEIIPRSRNFVLDTQAPSVRVYINSNEYGNLTNKALNVSSIIPRIEIEDNYGINPDAVKVSIKKYDEDGERELETPTLRTIANKYFSNLTVSQNLTFKNIEEDGIYVIHVDAEDYSGNRAEVFDQMISVNRNGSTFFLEKDSDTYNLVKKEVTTNTALDRPFVFYESNVDNVKRATISVETAHNGSIRLEEGKDYTVKDNHLSEYSLHVLEYSIDPSVFAREDHYTISVVSVDEANNRNDSLVKNNQDPESWDFFFDRTAPILMFEDLEDGGSYREDSHKFVIDTNTGDMTGVAKVEVSVGGTKVVYGYGDGVDQQIDPTGRIEVIVPSAGGARQQVVVTGIDGSGNPSSEYRFRVQVTTNKLLLFLNNAKALFASIGSIILLLILLAVLLIVRRRIKRQANK